MKLNHILRYVVLGVLAIVLFGVASPANAQGVSNFALSSAHCVITVTFTATAGGGTYYVTSWDDGNQVYSSPPLVMKEGDTAIVQIYTGPVILQGAAGIGVYVENTPNSTGTVFASNGSYNADVTLPCGTAGSPKIIAGSFAGPAIPAGFVLRTITCDVAVFDTAGGTPLGSGERIKAGQTWFVNPNPVSVTNNTLYPSWTEIFVSGLTNGFIPTSCVGGKPAGYVGN